MGFGLVNEPEPPVSQQWPDLESPSRPSL